MPTQFSFPLLPTSNVLVSGGARTTVGPVQKSMGRYTQLAIEALLTAVPTGGTPTLDLYLQHSMDQGVTWQDFANFHFTTTTGAKFAFVAGEVGGGTAVVAASDGALASNTVVQGPWGDQLRVKYNLGLAGGESGQYTVTVWVVPKGGVLH